MHANCLRRVCRYLLETSLEDGDLTCSDHRDCCHSFDNLDRYSKYPDLSDLEGSNLKTHNLEIDCSFTILHPFILFRIKGLACKEPGPKEREGPPTQHSPLQHKTEAALSSAGELMGLSSLSQVTQSHSVSSEPP